MEERQTQENLQKVIETEMQQFGLNYNQILAVTHDYLMITSFDTSNG